jgi:prepilin-type N-terminal cleavage/methylation domain-containing protein
MRSGFSIVELCVALTLLGIGLSVALPSARRQMDRMAVLAAREATVAHIERARREARLAGGSRLELRRDRSRLWIESGGSTRDTLELESRFGVRLEISPASATIPFDALGLGRLASRSLSFVRGSARAALIVSSYGRVRRQ